MHTIATSFAQGLTVNGTVVEQASGEGMPGVAILVKGTSSGTVTDADGRFNLQVPGEDAVLVFSFIGYMSQEVPVRGKSTINVTLVEDVESLEELVVVGYGTQKKATLTGSVSEVQGKEITQSPQPNVSNSLAGRISGVIANNRGGEPGYDGSNFSIRGLATTGNNDVLIVVDGVPGQIGGLDRLDPNDIESITVLKDASAAIYGSRAANGVILVTTKKGKAGKPTISYTFNQGFSSPTRLPEMADAATYAQIRNEIAYYNNEDGGLNQVYTEEEIQKFGDGSDPLLYPNTDWQQEALQRVALQNQHNLSVNGGTERINYFLSLGKLFQEGLYKNGATEYNQYNFRSNIDADITDRLSVGLFLSGRQEDRQFPTEGAGTIFRSIYRAYPTVVARYPNGLPSTGVENMNPIMMATSAGGTHSNPTYIFNGILKGRYDLPLVKGLSLDGFYSTDRSFSTSKNFRTPYALYRYNATTGNYDETVAGGGPNGKAQLNEESFDQFMTVGNIKLNYLRNFGSHNVNTFVGYEQSKFRQQTMGASRLHFPTTQTPELSQGGAAATDYNNWGSSYNFTRRSYISRIAYDYNEKYLAEVQLRIDGSSIFPKDNQWGFFPSVSAGWRISEENFFKNNISFINNLKLRASWGQLGNDNVGQFQYYDNYSFNNFYVIGDNVYPGINLTKLGNPNITWEVATKTDIGINATFLKNFGLELIYFDQKRNNILSTRNASIPATSGIVNPYDAETLVPSENIGKVNNKGLETTLSYNRTGNFSWGVSGNLTYAKNELVFKDEAPGVLDYQQETGRTLYTYLLYNAIGIYRSEEDLEQYPSVPGAKVGDLIYQDYNGDGEITADDMVRTKYGNIPQLTYGLSLNAGWKNFDFAVLFSGQSRVSQYVLPESGTIGNFYSSWADNRWSPTNPEGTYPRVDERASSAISGGLYRNNFWLNDASFVRLKNIQLGYSLPAGLLSKVNIADLRVYANAFNLLTFTKVKDYDPEGNNESGQFYPQQRIINLGVNVRF
ncbi:TonB-dependent receptor [Cesiribacter sp. SM1]|uniref:SusC/RagA family TonB-linked outer membrane protein n=1 Tax=Cesiribacter sp. SM1 TaxID=2861196 RepID=UPI001CD72759|nr:TonB-dependent receptor [Cesiribacter sp. SM1]